MTETYQSLSHAKWVCKYHLVFVPKRRRQVLYGEIRRQLKDIFHELAREKDCRIIEGHLMSDHVQMVIEIPPKFAVASIIGFFSQGQERDCCGPLARPRAQLHGRAFLGSWLRCLDGRV